MNRETWLEHALHDFAIPWFVRHNHAVPEKIRVAIGWPSRAGLATKNRRVGECWDSAISKDGSFQIWVSPLVDDPGNAVAILVHEVAHTIAGIDSKHGPAYRRVAKSVGLEGPMASTHPGEELAVHIERWLEDAPEWPAASLHPREKEPKKTDQNRQFKAECPECALGGKDERYVIRISRKTARRGLPDCPICGTVLELEEKANHEEDDE